MTDTVSSEEENAAAAEAIETFELPDNASSPQQHRVPDFLGSGFAGAPQTHAGAPDERRASTRRYEPKTVEDLYSLYPRIGQGDWKIRVERISPSSYGGVNIKGTLGDYYEPMPMDEFRRKFGGGTYTVMVMAPDERGEGPSHYRMLKSIKIHVPGRPRMTTLEDEDDSNMGTERDAYRPWVLPSSDPPEVRIQQLKIQQEERQQEREREREWQAQDRQERERLRRELEESRRLPDTAFTSIQQSASSSLAEQRESHRQSLSLYAEEVDRLRAELRSKADEVRDMSRQLIEAQQQAANTSRHIETEAMRSQKEMHAEATERERARHEEEIRRMRDNYEERLSALTKEHLGERQRYMESQQVERERLRDENRNRVEGLEQAQRREIDAMQRQHDARIEDMKRTHAQALDMMRDRCDREVSTIRESERTQAAFARETAGGREQLARDQVERLERDLIEERRKNEDLFRRLNKPTKEALVEAADLARLTGMVHRDEVEQSGGSETTLQQIFGLGKSLVENAPKMLEKMAAQRMQQQSMQVPMHVQRQPPQLPQRRPPPQRTQQQQQQQRPPQYPPISPPPQRPPQHPPRPIPGTTAPAASMPLGSGAPPSATPPPLSGVEPGQSPAVVQHEPETADFIKNFPRAKVGELLSSLEAAIRTGLIGSAQFAHDLVSQLGIDTARQLLQQFVPDDITAIMHQTPEGHSTAIVTREGRLYVAEVFAYAAQIVQEADQAVVAQGEALAQQVEVQEQVEGGLEQAPLEDYSTGEDSQMLGVDAALEPEVDAEESEVETQASADDVEPEVDVVVEDVEGDPVRVVEDG